MIAPIIWIVLPLFFSVLLWFLRDRRLVVIFLAAGFCFLLAIAALTFRIGEVFFLGPVSVEINPTLSLLGRSFVLQDGDRFILALVYFSAGLWFIASRVSGANVFFLPNGLATIAFLLAALTVEPFLFAALFIEIAVLLSIPMLLKPGETITQGVLRFLVFQTLAVPFILLAGWAFEQAPINPNSQALYSQAAIFLGLGFSFWLAVFPFHTWIPMIAEEGQPFVFSFLISMFSTTILVLSLDFFNSYSWLREEIVLLDSLLLVGSIMIVFGGVLAAFQKKLSRLLGFAYIFDIGFSMISISLRSQLGWETLIYALLPRIFSLLLFSLAISILFNNNQKKDELSLLEGTFYQFPFISITILLGWFSISGMPLFSTFPVKMTILSQIPKDSFIYTIWIMVGFAGMFFTGVRLFYIFFLNRNLELFSEKFSIRETTIQTVFLTIGSIILFLLGLFPSIFINIMKDVLLSYRNLF